MFVVCKIAPILVKRQWVNYQIHYSTLLSPHYSLEMNLWCRPIHSWVVPSPPRVAGFWPIIDYQPTWRLSRPISVKLKLSNFKGTNLTLALPGTVYPTKYAHGFCFAVLCCGYTLTDFPISIRLTSLALWQSNDCPSASKATLMNMDKYFMWIHYERLHNHNKAKHNKTVCIFLGIYCMWRHVCN